MDSDPGHMFMLYRCIDKLGIYVLLNSMSVTSGQLEGDDERKCAIETRSRL